MIFFVTFSLFFFPLLLCNFFYTLFFFFSPFPPFSLSLLPSVSFYFFTCIFLKTRYPIFYSQEVDGIPEILLNINQDSSHWRSTFHLCNSSFSAVYRAPFAKKATEIRKSHLHFRTTRCQKLFGVSVFFYSVTLLKVSVFQELFLINILDLLWGSALL